MEHRELKELTEWVKKTKGITKITIEELVDYYDEFKKSKQEDNLMKVANNDIGGCKDE